MRRTGPDRVSRVLWIVGLFAADVALARGFIHNALILAVTILGFYKCLCIFLPIRNFKTY